MSTSQGSVKDVLPKQFPFSNRRKVMIPQSKFDLGYHVTVLGKYSKKIPKREVSALDRRSTSTLKWYNDTTKFNPNYYKSHWVSKWPIMVQRKQRRNKRKYSGCSLSGGSRTIKSQIKLAQCTSVATLFFNKWSSRIRCMGLNWK